MKIIELCKEKWKNLTKRQKIIFVSIFVVLGIVGIITEDKVEQGIVTTDLKVCDSQNTCTEYKIMDKINIARTKDGDFKVYDKSGERKIGTISSNKVVFEGTEEYNKFKKEFETMQKAKEELIAERNKKELENLEPIITKTFYKIDLKKYSNDGNGIYDFYINPIVWNQLQFDEKENLFKNCTVYVQLKTNGTNTDFAKVGTTIKSSANGVILAKYSAFKGIELK